MITKKILFFFILVVAISSCNSNEDGDYSEYITQRSIETDIDFMPQEVYNSDETEIPVLKLKINTTKIYGCANYGLVTTEFTNDNELIVRFDEIAEPPICLTALGPAVSYIDLPDNVRKVTFLNGSKIDQYAFEIDKQEVIIERIESSFTNSLYAKTFRRPEKSFAYVCGTNKDNTYIYTDFLDILNQNSNFTEFSFGDEGRIPYPDSSDGRWVNHASKFYKYSDTTAFKNLKTTLKVFSDKNIKENSGVVISIRGWDNTNYYSYE